jgi:tagatose-1,6-bisphosphate aldolase non-catalytic subunit AgaZ/GatZ
VHLVLSAERLSLFGEHRVLSVGHLVTFAERLALFSISRALISRDMCLPATVGGIR